MTIRLAVVAALAIPLLLVSAPSEAQNSNPRNAQASSQTSNAAMMARHKCFLEAQAAIPMDNSVDPSVISNQRLPVYASCARKAGVRP